VLRREVELPLRLHQQPSFYLALASLLLSLLIVVDAAVWGRRAAERAQGEDRLRAFLAEIEETQREFDRLQRRERLDRKHELLDRENPRTAARLRALAARFRAASGGDPERADRHEQLMQQLEHP
jgi:hypothetical protein